MEHNLNASQRALYMMAGLGLAAASVKPRPNPLLNIFALASGAYLAWRGYEGSCPIKAAIFDGDHDQEYFPAE
ncbi:MAG: hypothetical protein Q8M31_16445 [Beijerinckiaceae bacterium]|nr:hypothetical protein [Beijerinckiaceae bacterium]